LSRIEAISSLVFIFASGVIFQGLKKFAEFKPLLP